MLTGFCFVLNENETPFLQPVPEKEMLSQISSQYLLIKMRSIFHIISFSSFITVIL